MPIIAITSTENQKHTFSVFNIPLKIDAILVFKILFFEHKNASNRKESSKRLTNRISKDFK